MFIKKSREFSSSLLTNIFKQLMRILKNTLIFVLGLFLGFFSYQYLQRKHASQNPTKEKFNRLLDYVDQYYVSEVNTDSIVDATINSILTKLDPHSVYIAPENAQFIAERMKGNFVGIGVNFMINKDTIVVIRTIPNGPSDQAGMFAGDRILMADKDTLYGDKLKQIKSVTTYLKGPLGSEVDLEIYRPQEGIKHIEVSRGVVPLKSVEVGVMINDTLGYIKIDRFAKTTYKEFKKALISLKKSGVSSLIVDLRDNSGGYISPAIDIADEFLEEDKLILFTKDREAKIDRSFATDSGMFEKGSVYVLIDENSASASEILAGALQDNDKGTIIGRRSFGKGLVQQEMELGDGSKVRLTVSKYYTPTGRSIQRPYDKGTEAYYNEYVERYESGELTDASKMKINDSLVFETPKGKKVYGGGGIIPDVYVSKDITNDMEILNFADYAGVIVQFVFIELDSNRGFYRNKATEGIDSIEVSEDLIKAFKKYAAGKGLVLKKGDIDATIKIYIQSEMARQLNYNDSSFQLKFQTDPMIQKVLTLEE